MKSLPRWLMVFSFSLGGAIWLPAQSVPADRFLDAVAAHSVGDQAERDQAMMTSMALSSASASEAERVLPAVMSHLRPGTEEQARGYADRKSVV